MRIKRRFVEVEGRRVHYRRAGDGPPLVLLHGSPGSSEMLEHEMAAAASSFTCIALDTPGFGSSDPLAGETLSVGDLARATAAAMGALRLPPCPVYGTHTGALIATELAANHSASVSGLLLEGLPIFTDTEIATLFEGYFAPMIADPLGGHLITTWVRFRDQFTWFPWLSRDVTRLNPVDRPTAEEIDHWVMMFYRSCDTYMSAYRAACHHGHRSYEAAARLTVPAIFMASAEDMLFPHLDRLPPLKPEQSIERLPYDLDAKYRTIGRLAGTLPQAPAIETEADHTPAGSDPACQFVDMPWGQTFVRTYGDAENPALFLLHDAPGSGLRLEPIARQFSEEFFVIVPDLPGCGESGDAAGSAIDAGASAISCIVDALKLSSFKVAATGCGCAVAARLDDPRLTKLLLDAPPHADPEVAMRIAPDIQINPEGSHWIEAWLMVRDSQIYQPWFDGRVAAQRHDQGNFDARWLHAQTFEIMKTRTSYHRLAREAWTNGIDDFLHDQIAPVEFGPLSSLLEIDHHDRIDA